MRDNKLSDAGWWFIDYAANGFGCWDRVFAGSGDANVVPVPADYDGDGKADLAVRDNKTGRWQIDYSANGFGVSQVQKGIWDAEPGGYGGANARPVPADYDGDGKADLAVKGSDGVWHIDFIRNGFGWDAEPGGYGYADAIPVPADYDGDRKADLAITGSTGWYVDFTSTGLGWDRQQLEYGCSSFGYSDLKLTGTIRLSGPGQVQIGVNNWGTLPAHGDNCGVKISGQYYACSLAQYFGGSAQAANTLNPGEKGFLQVSGVTLQECTSYVVAIDANRTMQVDPNQVGVFANDSGIARGQCLTWDSPITPMRLGKEPDPFIANKTIGDIVSSRAIARGDGYLCATCHNSYNAQFTADNLPKRYFPDVPQMAPWTLDPNAPLIGEIAVINGMSWQPPFGGSVTNNASWAREFIAVNRTDYYAKKQYLKDLFQKWLDDGAY